MSLPMKLPGTEYKVLIKANALKYCWQLSKWKSVGAQWNLRCGVNSDVLIISRDTYVIIVRPVSCY